MAFFPRLRDATWSYVNLSDLHDSIGRPDMHSVDTQNAVVPLRLTFGGFLEDRTALWAGFEPHMKRMVHLGVDLNGMDPGEPVCLIEDAKVVHVMRDVRTFNGWGGRVIFRLERTCPFPYLLFGHLDAETLRTQPADHFRAGEVFANVANSSKNGGWFPHLHVQQMSEAFVASFADLDDLDGYADCDSMETLREWVCDPLDPLVKQ